MSDMNKVFVKAAKLALMEWEAHQWDRQRAERDDLSQSLWVWYASRATTRKKMAELNFNQQVETARKAAIQILSREVLDSNTFQGRDLYSSDAVRASLRGQSKNKYLNAVIPLALKRVDRRNPRYREAIRSRYDDGIVPEHQSPARNVLQRAVKSLTEEVNVVYLTSNPDAIGSRAATWPELRKRRGEYADPTAGIVESLLDRPSYRDSYLEETPFNQILGGAGELPVYPVTERINVRPSGEEAETLKRWPTLITPYLAKVRERVT